MAVRPHPQDAYSKRFSTVDKYQFSFFCSVKQQHTTSLDNRRMHIYRYSTNFSSVEENGGSRGAATPGLEEVSGQSLRGTWECWLTVGCRMKE